MCLLCNSLLRRHRPPLSPGKSLGLLSKFGADSGHHTLVVRVLAQRGKEGEEIEWAPVARRAAQRFGRAPELRCPDGSAPACHHTSPLLETEGHALFIIHLPEEYDTSLAQGEGFRPLALYKGDARQPGKDLRYVCLQPLCFKDGQTLFKPRLRFGRITLSERQSS